MEKKNTGLVVLVVVLVLLVVGLSGFIVYDKMLSKDDNTTAEKNDNNKEENINKFDETKDIIYSGISYNISGHNDEMNGLSEIPQINLNNDNIKQINDEIINYFKNIMKVDEFKDNYKYGFDSSCDKIIYNIQYEYYNNDNILSLLIKYTLLSEAYEESSYMIYNINPKTGEIITNNELIKIMNYKTDDIKEGLINSINKFYAEKDLKKIFSEEESHDSTWSNYIVSSVINLLSKYINENNTYIPLYINEEGTLSTYIRIPVAGGGGFDSVILTIE